MSVLPKNQREVIRMKFQFELSYQEISEITGLSTSNVGYLIHVGVKALKKKLNPETDNNKNKTAQVGIMSGGKGQVYGT